MEINMKSIWPESITIGDSIGIVAPSEKVTNNKLFDTGINQLISLGFNIKLGNHLNTDDPSLKADDLNRMFSDPTVKAVFCAQGGNIAEQTLKYVDWSIVKCNPKILVGISDITVLLNAFNHYAGFITFHGGDITYGLGKHFGEYASQSFFDILVNRNIGHIPANGPRQTIRPGSAEGILKGGNLRCLLKLAETDFWPDFNDSILMLEAFNIDESRCLNCFKQLDSYNVFDKINGAIVGHVYSMEELEPANSQMEDLLLDFTKDKQFPILKIQDFGHNCQNYYFPIGARAYMNSTEKQISIL